MQISLFDQSVPEALPPPGLRYQTDFLSPDEESELIALIRTLPLSEAQYKQYSSRRRIVSYGGSFDFDALQLLPATPLIEALHPLRDRVAAWIGVPPQSIVHTLVAEYPPGAPLGWHRDVPQFEDIVGVSLGSEAMLRFRRYPPVRPDPRDVLRLSVAPRSIYVMRGHARWQWQHSVAPTAALRWSITFRTRNLYYQQNVRLGSGPYSV